MFFAGSLTFFDKYNTLLRCRNTYCITQIAISQVTWREIWTRPLWMIWQFHFLLRPDVSSVQDVFSFEGHAEFIRMDSLPASEEELYSVSIDDLIDEVTFMKEDT